jgi:hypothetical protein
MLINRYEEINIHTWGVQVCDMETVASSIMFPDTALTNHVGIDFEA